MSQRAKGTAREADSQRSRPFIGRGREASFFSGEARTRLSPVGVAVQPRMELGRADDRFEREAEQAATEATQVGATDCGCATCGSDGAASEAAPCGPPADGSDPTPRQPQALAPKAPGPQALQRVPAAGGAAGEGPRSPAAEGGGTPLARGTERRVAALRGGGVALPPSERAFFESRLDADFGAVRVHTGAPAAELASDLHAQAFTLGTDIAFAPGRYQPGTRSGQHLLAHELAHVVQQGGGGGGNGGEPARIRRQETDDTSEGEPELIEQLENNLELIDIDAAQDQDLELRAYANREALLLRHRAHPRFETQDQLDDFLTSASNLADTELDTINALGSMAEFALGLAPQGFPLTWSGRVHAALTLGVDMTAVLGEVATRLAALTAESRTLPARIAERGLAVPLAQLGGLSAFGLRIVHAQAPRGSVTGDFARSTLRYAQFRFLSNFALTWEVIVTSIAEAVAEGTYVPRYADYLDFVQNKQQILRSLPARARERLAMSEAELLAIQQDTVGLADAALLSGMAGALSGVLGIFSGWDQGVALFADALPVADGLVAGAGNGERLLMAFRWAWEAGYVGDALREVLAGLVANGPQLVAELAGIVILQMIPFVNVAVDIYLAFRLGLDVLSLLGELGMAFSEVLAARSVLQMQRAAGRLARVLVAGGVQILTVLVTLGVVRGVSALRQRTAALRAANPALTEEAAMQRAFGEASAAERAPLESARELSGWERGLTSETRPILDTPGVRQRLGSISARTRRLLTMCESPCLPPAHQLLAADLQRLDGILERLGVTGEHAGLREYFYRRRASLADAIEQLERGTASGGSLADFLDRAIIRGASAPTGTQIFRDSLGRWVYRRAPGTGGGLAAEVVEYDLRAYGVHGREYGTDSFFQSHHGVQGQWAIDRGIRGYQYSEAPGILLRDSRAGSPHRIITGRQSARASTRSSRTYVDERRLLRQDLEAASVPEAFIVATERANDVYFGGLFRVAEAAGATEAQLTSWFGTWRP